MGGQVFEELWGTNELLVSFDSVNICAPGFEGSKPWLHTDQRPAVEGLACVQGLINLVDVSAATTGALPRPASHLVSACSTSALLNPLHQVGSVHVGRPGYPVLLASRSHPPFPPPGGLQRLLCLVLCEPAPCLPPAPFFFFFPSPGGGVRVLTLRVLRRVELGDAGSNVEQANNALDRRK